MDENIIEFFHYFDRSNLFWKHSLITICIKAKRFKCILLVFFFKLWILISFGEIQIYHNVNFNYFNANIWFLWPNMTQENNKNSWCHHKNYHLYTNITMHFSFRAKKDILLLSTDFSFKIIEKTRLIDDIWNSTYFSVCMFSIYSIWLVII